MAKKGLFAQIYAERQRAQRQREQEARRHERELEQLRVKEMRAEAARLRKEEAAERARIRKAEQSEREKAAREARRARDREQQAERADKERARLQEQKAREMEKLRVRREAEQAKERARRQSIAERERARKEALKAKVAEQRREREQARAVAQAEVMRLEAEAEQRTAEVEQIVEDIQSTLARRDLDLSSRATTSDAIRDLVLAVLSASAAPSGTGERDVQYDPDTRELLIKYDLPRQDVVPKIEAFKHLRSKKTIRPVERKTSAVVALYETLVAQTAVRVMAEVLAATPPDRVESVLLNGHVTSVDAGTGHPIQPSILSVLTGRSEFEAMNLDAVDAVACLHRLNAIVSPHPYDLVPVRPVWTFDPSRYKFVQEQDIVAGLDHRPDLLQLSPSEFEHLIRRLYEAMGLKAWVTQASKDEGVDAIAVNEDPALFGKCVIQAKRYRKTVDAESVYALAGVMEAHKASTGILVTTSYFGSGSKKFAQQHGRMQLHDARHLKKLLQEFLDLDVLISLEKMPADWRPIDVGKAS